MGFLFLGGLRLGEWLGADDVGMVGFNAFDDDPWVVRLVEYVREILQQRRVRIIGVCYGHQIVGRALGAKVARSDGGAWEVSVCQVIQTAKGKELFGGKDALVCLLMLRVGWSKLTWLR